MPQQKYYTIQICKTCNYSCVINEMESISKCFTDLKQSAKDNEKENKLEIENQIIQIFK